MMALARRPRSWLSALLVLATGAVPSPADDPTFIPAVDTRVAAQLARVRNDLGAGVSDESIERSVTTLGSLAERADGVVEVNAFPTPGAGRRYLASPLVIRQILRDLDVGPARAYREARGGVARSRLDDALASGDLEQLSRLARECPLTSAGSAALEILADRAFEEGEYRRASELYRELLLDQASSGATFESTALRLIASLRFLGDQAGWRAERAEHLSRAAARGDLARARSDLARIESNVPFPETPRRIAPRSPWGGEGRIGRLPTLPGRSLRLSWDSWVLARGGGISLPASPISGREDPRIRRVLPVRSFLPLPDHPFVPVAVGDRILLPGVFDVFELDGRPGRGGLLRVGRRPDPEGVRSARVRYMETMDSVLQTLTWWGGGGGGGPAQGDGSLLVGSYVWNSLSLTDYLGFQVRVNLPIRALVAFDGRTGEVRWRTEPVDPSSGPDAPSRPSIRGRLSGRDPLSPGTFPADISYLSPAVVRAGRVFVAGWSQEGFVHCHVRALDSGSGKVIWDTLVSSGQLEQTMFGELAREPFAPFLLEEAGTIYCQTNLGAVAALDATSGRLLWVTTYESIPCEPTRGRTPIYRHPLPWSAQGPVRWGPLLILTPRDSEYLLAVDAGLGPSGRSGAGRILWSYRNRRGELRDLLGVHAGKVYFTSSEGVARLDLSRALPDGRLAEGERARLERMAVGRRRGRIPARGDLCRSGVVFADAEALWLVGWDLGAPRRLTSEPFPSPRDARLTYAGRVRVLGDLVVVTSNHGVSAWEAMRGGGSGTESAALPAFR